MAGVNAGGNLSQHPLKQFVEGNRLAARSRQHGELTHFFTVFFRASAGRLEKHDDHADTKSGVEEMIECEAEQMDVLLRPESSIDVIKAQKQECAGEQFTAVASGGIGRTPEHQTGTEAYDASENGSFPAGVTPMRCYALIVAGRQRYQESQPQHLPMKAVWRNGILHDGSEKQRQGGCA